MSERKRSRRRKDEYTSPEEQEEADKPSKDEYAIAKWLKKNVRTKRTKFLSHNVEYFTANKALDALLSSKYAEGDKCLFSSRESAIEFLDVMLEHKFFHRARKVTVFPEDLKSKSSKKSINVEKDKENEKAPPSSNVEQSGEGSQAEGISNEEQAGKEKKKRKIRLDMHPDQVFVDGSEAYVWIYDPVPIYYWIYGLALVLGAIVVCLFPLWPPILRKGVYYLSIAAAGFLVFILILTIVRLIIFVIVWVLTGGKLYFWIFPNLTEDVGFLASFWPLYDTEYYVESGSPKLAKKSKKKKKDKDSDGEDDGEQQLIEPEKIESIKENETGSVVLDSDNITDTDLRRRKTEKDDFKKDGKDDRAEGKENTTPSESESEGSRSSTGKDFEILDAPKTVSYDDEE